jgi:hypothetical protein
VSAPCVVEPGVVVPFGFVVGLSGTVVELPGVTVPLPAPVAGGTFDVPGPPLLHGAINADVAEVEGLVELPLVAEPAPVVVVVGLVADPAPERAELVALVVVVSVPVRGVVEPAGAAVPVVPTAAVSGDVRPLAVVVLRVSSPARAVVALLVVPAPFRATVPLVVLPARAVSAAGTHGNTVAFGPDGPGWVAPDGLPGCVVPDWVVPVAPVAPGDVTPDVPVCVGLEGVVLVL